MLNKAKISTDILLRVCTVQSITQVSDYKSSKFYICIINAIHGVCITVGVCEVQLNNNRTGSIM